MDEIITPPQSAEHAACLEAMLYVCGEPLNIADAARALNIDIAEMHDIAMSLKAHYESTGHGLRLKIYMDEMQLSTAPQHAEAIERLLSPIKKQPLSQAALETLSVIAYRQPVTKADIEAVRGVKCDYSVQALQSKQLIEEVGRKDALGRPILYGTTTEFLRHFGISSLAELPPLPEIELDNAKEMPI